LGLNGGTQIVNRNIVYLVIGALVVAVGVVSYLLYQERQKTTGIEIDIGERGISIQKR
jgi:predicted negative regulator of RcsB-dependent stress response